MAENPFAKFANDPLAGMDTATSNTTTTGDQPSVVGSTLRGVVRGVTFGFGDELRAGTDALAQGAANLIHGSEGRPSMGEAYDTSLAANREQDRRDVATNPVSSTTGQLAGSVAPMLLAPELGLARLVGRVAAPIIARINPMMEAIPGWLQSTGRLVAGGATAGGVAGFGEGEGIGDRAGGAITGALTGAAVAPVVKAVTAAAPVVVSRVGALTGLRDPQTAADRQIVRALDRGGVSVDEAAARLTAAGDNPTALVDVGGRNVVNLGATAANTPGTSMEAADQFVQGRRIGRPDRLMTAGDTAFGGGSGTDIADITASRQAQRTAEASPLYREAFAKPAGMTEPMQEIIQHPIGQTGLKRGLEIQDIENTTRRARGEPEVPTTDPAIHYDDNGNPRIVGVPNMRSLDAIKRGMDAMIEDARDKTSGRIDWTERLHAVDDMRRTWVGLLDENNPEYAAARAAWGGPSAQMEATQAGRTALRTDRDIVAQRAASGPPDVQDAYRLGVGRDFSDRVSDPGRASGATRVMLEDTNMQTRLRSVLGQDRLDALNAVLRRETGYTDVERAVGPRAGSQTARLTAGGEDMATDVAGPVVTGVLRALGGHPIAGARDVLQEYLQRRIGQGINPATADALANRLFTTDQASGQRVTEALRNRLMQDQVRTEMAQRFVRPVIGALAETGGSIATRR